MRGEGKEKKISKESGSKTDMGKGGKKGGERRTEEVEYYAWTSAIKYYLDTSVYC